LPDKIRVAALQYFIRPVRHFDDFADQVRGLVATAADYKAHLLVFPEYFTVQLLTLGDVRRPIRDQIVDLAGQGPRVVELMQGLAREHGIHIQAGTIPVLDGQQLTNVAYLFNPSGEFGTQGKIHITRWEREEWKMSAAGPLRVFDTALGKVAITICYDVEFPELARVAARAGATILLAPSCTDDRQGFLRVRYCAHARAIENQMYVVHASTVGSLPMVPAVALNWGQAAILTPSDFPFSRDGILAEGSPNQESMVIGDLNVAAIWQAREAGTVLPLHDSEQSADVAFRLETVSL